jgi:butyrate kinase
MKTYKIFAINIGSTSTKAAYYEDERCVIRKTLEHPSADLIQFERFWDQENYRKDAVEAFLLESGIALESLDAIATWGGHTEPVEDGIYRITPKLLEQSRSEKYGNHPGDLGPRLAYELALQSGNAQAFTIDPPTIDEFGPLARYSGLPEIKRKSRMQSLNQKATARKYAKSIGRKYEDLNLIVVHMGGGTSVVAHDHGKMVDANNGLDGDGPFATNRSGALPVGDLIDLCFSGRHTHAEMRRKVTGEGGLVAYLGENDVRAIEQRAREGDGKYAEVLDAMLYQTAKEIGATAAVLCGKVDAVLLAGGIAHSSYIVEKLRECIGFIAPVEVYAGELEMESLGLMSFAALNGMEPIKEL